MAVVDALLDAGTRTSPCHASDIDTSIISPCRGSVMLASITAYIQALTHTLTRAHTHTHTYTHTTHTHTHTHSLSVTHTHTHTNAHTAPAYNGSSLVESLYVLYAALHIQSA